MYRSVWPLSYTFYGYMERNWRRPSLNRSFVFIEKVVEYATARQSEMALPHAFLTKGSTADNDDDDDASQLN